MPKLSKKLPQFLKMLLHIDFWQSCKFAILHTMHLCKQAEAARMGWQLEMSQHCKMVYTQVPTESQSVPVLNTQSGNQEVWRKSASGQQAPGGGGGQWPTPVEYEDIRLWIWNSVFEKLRINITILKVLRLSPSLSHTCRSFNPFKK